MRSQKCILGDTPRGGPGRLCRRGVSFVTSERLCTFTSENRPSLQYLRCASRFDLAEPEAAPNVVTSTACIYRAPTKRVQYRRIDPFRSSDQPRNEPVADALPIGAVDRVLRQESFFRERSREL